MDEPSLRDTQQWMKSRIRPAAAPPSGPAPALNAQRGTPGEERLSVYAEGFLARTREALAEVYEAVHRVLGEGEFTRLAHAYAERFPSRDYNLSLSGRHLPELLDDSPLRGRLPFLADLARLEWRVCLAFHAFDQPPADLRELAAMPLEAWGGVRLAFQPSVGVISSAWPIGDIWAARRQPPGAINIAIEGRPQQVAVARQGAEVTCRAIDRPQYELLSRLLRGATLGEACAILAQEGAAAPPVADWFAGWASAGWVARVDGSASR